MDDTTQPGPPRFDGDMARAETVIEVAATADTMAPGATTQPNAMPMPGRIGRYAVLDALGQGAMGRVFAAYDPNLDRRVAVKVLHGRTEDAEQSVRIRREAHALARLSHPNVVQVFEVGRFEQQTYIAMEYVDGGTLEAWQRAETRPWQAVVDMYVQVGAGLRAAHDAGLIHRDFKPQNVLVGADGRPRIIDFGLARAEGTLAEVSETSTASLPPEHAGSGVDLLRSPLTRDGSFLGTPAYMGPEQMTGEGVGPASDQFGFCVALYEALYDRSPFDNRTIVNRLRAMRTGAIAPQPAGSAVPPRVHRALLRGMAAQPGDRWPSMSELLDALGGDAKADRTVGWQGRVLFFGAMMVFIVGPAAVNWRLADGLRVTTRSMGAMDLLLVVCFTVLGVVYREPLLASPYNRRLAAWVGVMLYGPLALTIVGRLTGTPGATVAAFVLAGMAMVSILAALLVARWAWATVAVLLVGAFTSSGLPDFTVATYGLSILGAASTGVIGAWAEARRAGDANALAALSARGAGLSRITGR